MGTGRSDYAVVTLKKECRSAEMQVNRVHIFTHYYGTAQKKQLKRK